MVLKWAFVVGAVLLAFVLGVVWGKYGKPRKDVYVLKQPLKIESSSHDTEENYFLPPGTVLYHDWSPPEGGFNRYFLYVNVHGADWRLTKTEKDFLKSPLTAWRE